jgi:hypothetical protein
MLNTDVKKQENSGLLFARDTRMSLTAILIQNRYNEYIEVHKANLVLAIDDVNLFRKVINNKIKMYREWRYRSIHS